MIVILKEVAAANDASDEGSEQLQKLFKILRGFELNFEIVLSRTTLTINAVHTCMHTHIHIMHFHQNELVFRWLFCSFLSRFRCAQNDAHTKHCSLSLSLSLVQRLFFCSSYSFIPFSNFPLDSVYNILCVVIFISSSSYYYYYYASSLFTIVLLAAGAAIQGKSRRG